MRLDRSSIFFRSALGLVFLLAVSWLAFDAYRAKGRRAAITACLRDGNIGGLTPEETDRFHALLVALTSEMSAPPVTSINDRLDRPGLKVYTCLPAAAHATGCQPGNAIYDARMDAIFVDVEMVHDAMRVPANQWELEELYLAFVLCHEIGHRQLHSRNAAMFDSGFPDLSDQAAMKRELEADAFSLDQMQRFYAADLRQNGAWIGIAHRSVINANDEPLDDADRLWLDMLVLSRDLVVRRLQDNAPYSSLYKDFAHPSLVERTAKLLDRVTIDRIKSPQLRTHFGLIRDQLTRIQEGAANPICEITAPEPIAVVLPAPAGPILVARSGALYSTPWPAFTNTDSLLLRAVATSMNAPSAPLANVESLIGAWTYGHRGLVLAGRLGRLYVFDGDEWSVRELRGPIRGRRFIQRIWCDSSSDPSHSTVFLLSGATIEDETRDRLAIHSFRGADELASRTVHDIEAEVAAKGAPSSLRVEVASPLGDALHLAVYDASREGTAFQPLTGVASVDASELRVASYYAVAAPADNDAVPILVAVKSPAGIGEPTYYACGMDFSARVVDTFAVWQLNASTPAVRVLQQPWWRSAMIGDTVTTSADPWLASTAVLSDDTLILNFAQDSVYAVDLNRHLASILFHPGGGQVVAHSGGEVLILPSAAGSDRCYVVLITKDSRP